MRDVLVIIVTFNSMKWIDKCLGSLSKSSVPVDIFIVDNNSTDNTVDHVKKNYQYVQLIESKINLGFGKANNLGLEFAVKQDYSFVYLLNQDAWIFENTLNILLEAYKSDISYGVLSPMQTNAGIDKLDFNFQLCCPRQMLSDLFFKKVKNIYETPFVMAAHWLLPLDSIKKVGGFSSSFPHYGEDNNYLHRVAYFGLKIGIVPEAIAVHDREFRVDSKELRLKKLYIDSVVEVNNINLSLPVTLLKQTFRTFIRVFQNKSFLSLRYFFKLILNYPKFIINRNKSKHRAFLN